ncbi:unnamed protein product [Chrysodeixis includens]|uniref:Uncharacterized protein n=1 Tax=Chrysodeixis includens TaxID=689277 RepID=A0A9N8PYB1_CHRIL|nr:unnamed protein product [Chrysodeixis includens]
MTSLPSSSRAKREIQVDDADVPAAKQPKVIKNPLKVKCLNLIIKSFEGILECIAKLAGSGDDGTTPAKDKQALLMDITLANNITKIIYKAHKLRLQESESKMTSSDFKFSLSGRQVVVRKDRVMEIWDAQVKSVGLVYSKHQEWYDTIMPFLTSFLGFSLRMAELKRGFKYLVLKSTDVEDTVLPINKYGLSEDRHHTLLEGISYPPNIRQQMVRECWLGPMTAFLCMLCSKEPARENYEHVVQKTMPHIPCIQDIIKITRKNTNKMDLVMISHSIAEILLRNPVTENFAMFFPLNFLVVAAAEHNTTGKLDWFLDFFSLTGSGGFYMYKAILELQATHKFTIRSCMNEEMASQVCFHCIFGTFKQDFGILSSITPNKNWVTGRQVSTSIKSKGSLSSDVEIELIPFKVYSKPDLTEDPVLLVTPHREYVRSQYTSSPCFSGYRVRNLFVPGFSNREPIILQIRNILNDTLEKLREYLKDKPCLVTTRWRDWDSLALGTHGEDMPDFQVTCSGVTFAGKRDWY